MGILERPGYHPARYESGKAASERLRVLKSARFTYAKHREYCQFPGRFVVCTVGVAEPWMGVPVWLYRLIRSRPPQNSEPFPVQGMEQSVRGAGEATLLMAVPQSSGSTVSGQKIEAIDSTYSTRDRIPLRPESNPRRGKHRCNFEHCCDERHHQGRAFGG
jgi:hypothetical protein